MSGIGVVLNPYSKSYKKNPDKLKRMAFIVGDKASCKPTQDMADLHRVADEFKSRDVDILAISGGDGTIHCTLTAFLKVYGEKPLPKITFLRGGTLNTIAATMGIKGQTEMLLSELLIKYHEDRDLQVRRLRLTKINESYGCIFGLGVVYNFMEDYYKNPVVNPFVAGKTLIATVLSAFFNGKIASRMFARVDAEVTVDGVRWPFANYSALFSGSIRQAGLEFNVFRHMLEQNEKFHAIGMSITPQGVIPYLKRLHDGKPPESEDIIDAAASQMHIKLEKPLPYTIDGDMLEPQDEFRLSIGPELTVVF